MTAAAVDLRRLGRTTIDRLHDRMRQGDETRKLSTSSYPADPGKQVKLTIECLKLLCVTQSMDALLAFASDSPLCRFFHLQDNHSRTT
jgi:hypothetical protein